MLLPSQDITCAFCIYRMASSYQMPSKCDLNPAGASISELPRRRLLIVATSAITIKTFLLSYAAHFRALGWKVDAAASGLKDCPACSAAFSEVFDLEWSRNPLDFISLWQATGRLRQLVEKGGYHIVHCHTPIAGFITRFALRKLRPSVRVVYTAHGFHFHEYGSKLTNFVYRSAERLAAAWTDALILINSDDFLAAKKFRRIDSCRIHLFPGVGIDLNAYSASSFAQTSDAIRAELHLSHGTHLLLMIAEFNPGKRHRDALAVLQRLNDLDVHLAFAGSGKCRHEIERLTMRLGLSGRVHFLGFRSDVLALLRAAVVMLFPSEREGLPKSVMESMAAGTPVVAYHVRGVRDLLGNGAGVCVPLGDVETLATELRRLLNDLDFRQRTIDKASERVRDFGLNGVLGMHVQLYSELLHTDATNSS